MRRLSLICFLAILIALFSFSCKNSGKQPTMKIVGKDTLYLLTMKTFQIKGGWGYDIFTGDKIFIHQDQVPALAGQRVFETEEDAKKAADIVIEKIKENKIPSLDSTELLRSDIHYK